MKKFGRKITIFWVIIICVQIAFSQDYQDKFLNGKIDRIQSEILKQNKMVFIYLPNNYSTSDKLYPVHYITDGPATSNMFYNLLHLHSSAGNMPEGIVVGLSSDNRGVNLHIKKEGKKYLKFIEKELIPFINKNYRTNSFKSINGHSLGAGFAIYAFFNKLDIFNLCIAGSPFPLNGLLTNMSNNYDSDELLNKRYLFSSIGTKNDIGQQQFLAFRDRISQYNYQFLESSFRINSGENHISNIAVNFQKGLESFYSNWKFSLPDTLKHPIDILLKKHYEKLSKKVGYKVEVSEWEVVYPIMDKLAKSGDFQNAIRILKYCVKIHPKSDQAYAFLARAHLSIQDMESARNYLEKSLSINPNNKLALQIKQMLNKG